MVYRDRSGDPLFSAEAPARAAGASVTFEPAARTAWHTHPLGQTLIVTAGCGRAQREGHDVSELKLQAMVPANDIPELNVGMKATLAIDGFGERRFTGTIDRINPTTEAGTRAILVFVHVPNPDGALRGGMFVTGRVTLAFDFYHEEHVETQPAVQLQS